MGVEEVLTEAKARLEVMIAPINDGVGEDASYDEAFEAIKAELDKVNALEGGTTDWAAVERHAHGILSERSKDFRVALYYAAAATHTRKFAGIFDGTIVLLELCNNFWEPMWPALKRPRARGNLCSWLSEAAGPIVQQMTPTAKERDAVKALAQSFRQLDGLLAEKLGDAYSGMMGLRDSINNLVLRVPADPVVAPPPASIRPASLPSSELQTEVGGGDDSASYQAPAGGLGISITDIVDQDSAFRALAEIAPLVGRAGDVMLENNLYSADGFRLGRVAAWLLVAGVPYNEGGQTQIDAPEDHVVQSLAELAAAQDYNGMLVLAGQVAAQNPLYLDATRYLALALENLGPDYEMARNAVMRETGALLARAPDLPSMTFANGVPFANEETKQWAKGIAAGGGGGGRAASPVDKAVIDAEKLFAAGQTPQAIGLLSRVANQVSAPAYRFRARLEIAKLCIKGTLFDIALAQLEALERVADEHRLAAWDPELCAEMYANLYRARRAYAANNTEDADLPRKLAMSLQRLCELDAAQALLVMQETPA